MSNLSLGKALGAPGSEPDLGPGAQGLAPDLGPGALCLGPVWGANIVFLAPPWASSLDVKVEPKMDTVRDTFGEQLGKGKEGCLGIPSN